MWTSTRFCQYLATLPFFLNFTLEVKTILKQNIDSNTLENKRLTVHTHVVNYGVTKNLVSTIKNALKSSYTLAYCYKLNWMIKTAFRIINYIQFSTLLLITYKGVCVCGCPCTLLFNTNFFGGDCI